MYKIIRQRQINRLLDLATEAVNYSDSDEVSQKLAYLRGYVRGVMENLTVVAEDDYAEELMRRGYGS